MTIVPGHGWPAAEASAPAGPTGRRAVDPRSWEIGEAFHQAMLLEVCAGPKPGLVYPGSNGAHTDMGLLTFMVGAAALSPALVLCAQSGGQHAAALPSLLPELRRIGVRYERRLLAATRQVNTQRGILFSAGLLCGAAGFLSRTCPRIESDHLLDAVAAMSHGLVERELAGADLAAKPRLTAGEQLYLRYGATGIRGEMEKGLPAVRETGLPALRQALDRGCSANMAMVHCLMALMTRVEDTTILWRKGPETLRAVQDDARRILDMGSVFSPQGLSNVFSLDSEYKSQNISPGGCADLLAVSIGVYLLVHGSLPCEFI